MAAAPAHAKYDRSHSEDEPFAVFRMRRASAPPAAAGGHPPQVREETRGTPPAAGTPRAKPPSRGTVCRAVARSAALQLEPHVGRRCVHPQRLEMSSTMSSPIRRLPRFPMRRGRRSRGPVVTSTTAILVKPCTSVI